MKKRLLALILVVCLVLGMLPMTAFAAEEKTVTITFDNTSKRTEFSGEKQVWTENGITVTNLKHESTNAVADYSNPARFYAGSSLNIAITGGNITKIVATCGSSTYASNLAKSAGTEGSSSGTTATITLTTPASSYSIAKMSGQARVKSIAVTYTETAGGETESSAPACQHANTTTTTVDATCTDAGSTTVTCDDCGATISTETIAATGHNYVDGVCTACGDEVIVMSGNGSATITFDNTSKRTVFTTEQQVWTENGVTVTNNKANSTTNVADYSAPARFYKSSELVIAISGENITKIDVACNTAAYANDLSASVTSGTATVSGKVVTIIPAGAAESYTMTLSGGQARVDSITVYYGATCEEHTWSKVDCTQNAVCTVCGMEGAAGEHTKVVTAEGEGYTISVCSVCQEEFIEAEAYATLPLDVAAKLALAGTSSSVYYIEGTVKSITSTTYGNMYITDGTNELYVYGTYDATGDNRYGAMESKPVVGDTVVLSGKLASYNGAAQMQNGWIKSFTHEHDWVDATYETPKTCSTCGATEGEALFAAAIVGEDYVGSWEEALEEWDAGETIKLLADLELSEPLTIDKAVTLDGNGYTLTYTGSNRAIDITNDAGDAAIEILDLTVYCSASYCERGINYNATGSLELAGVNVSGANLNYVVNLPGKANGAEITVNNCALTGNFALNIWGTDCTVNANNCTLTGTDNSDAESYAVVKLNNDGATSAEGTVINITNSTITTAGDSPATYNGTATGVINIDGAPATDAKPVAVINYGTNSYTFTSLQDAIDKAAAGETVILLADVELAETLKIAADDQVVLDLNGHTISGVDTTTANFSLIENNGDLTIKSSVEGGKITLTAENDNGTSRSSAVIANVGNGSLTVESGAIAHLGGNYLSYAIDSRTNGNLGNVSVTINGGEISSASTVAVRQFLNSTTCSNSLVVNGGSITSTSRAISMQNSNAKANMGSLEINGGEHDAIYIYSYNEDSSAMDISIKAECVEDVTAYLTGEVLENVNGTYGKVEAVATLEGYGYYYTSLEEAVNAYSDVTVVLLKDVTGSGIVIDHDITIDLNGHTYTFNKTVGSAGTTTLGLQILKDNNVTIKNGTLTSTAVTEGKEVKMLIQNYANLTLEDVNLVDNTEHILYALSNNSGNIELKGNTSITTDAVAFDVYDYSSAGYSVPSMVVNTTGTITGNIEVSETASLVINSGLYSIDVTEWCADNFMAKQNAESGLYEIVPAAPKAEVSAMDPVTLKAGEYDVWNGSLSDGTEELYLPIVMNFKALETAEEIAGTYYEKWLVDFYLEVNGLAEGSIVADGCYLAGNYGTFGWIVIPTDGMELEEGVEYPVVSNYDATLNYKDICKSVQEFIAAIHVSNEILEANPDFSITLRLKMTNPEDKTDVLQAGEDYTFYVKDLKYCEHEYLYACDAHCMHCGELTNEDAAHKITHVEESCYNVEYWTCEYCGSVWTDEALTQVSNRMNVIKAVATHELVHVEESCYNVEYWYCEACETVWTDEALTQISNHKSVIKPVAEHELVHVEESCYNVEYWYCEACETVWADAALTQITNRMNVIKAVATHELVYVAESCYNIEHWYCEACDTVWTDEALTQISNHKNVIKAEPTHELVYVAESCYNVEHWYCEACGTYWADEALTQITNSKNVIKAVPSHNLTHVEANAATCTANGNIEHWYCDICETVWADEALTEITNHKSVIVPAHGLEYFAAVEATNCQTPGHDEYWYCAECNIYYGDAEASWQHNPGWLFTTGDHVRPEGAADCATVACVLCGEDSYGTGEHDTGVPACQTGTCSKCHEEIIGYGCANYDTPACMDGTCYYCGGFVAGFGHENGAWAPCQDGECSYGCGLQYPATQDHVDEDSNDYCDLCWTHLNHDVDPCVGGECSICWTYVEGAHDYEYVNNGNGTHSVVCSACGTVETENEAHSYPTVSAANASATCVCGEEVFAWMGMSVALESSLETNFVVNASLLPEGNYYALIEKEVYNKATGEITIETTRFEAADFVNYNDAGTAKKIVFTDIAAKQMADRFTVTIYNEAGEQISASYTRTMEEYLLGVLADSKTSAAKKVVCVDFLNYGAAAQDKFGYRTSELVNSQLTEDQKALATDASLVADVTDERVKGAAMVGTAVAAEYQLVPTFVYQTSKISSVVKAVVSYTDFNGNTVSYEIAAADFENYNEKGTAKKIEITGTAVADGASPITVQLVDASGNVVDESVECVNYFAARSIADHAVFTELLKLIYSSKIAFKK